MSRGANGSIGRGVDDGRKPVRQHFGRDHQHCDPSMQQCKSKPDIGLDRRAERLSLRGLAASARAWRRVHCFSEFLSAGRRTNIGEREQWRERRPRDLPRSPKATPVRLRVLDPQRLRTLAPRSFRGALGIIWI